MAAITDVAIDPGLTGSPAVEALVAAAVDTACASFAVDGFIPSAPQGTSSMILIGGIPEAPEQRVQRQPSLREPTHEIVAEIVRMVVLLTGHR
ncbi:hypothetical protein AAGW05_16355 [Arthrobacter sp. LAPM80]|uniref:hypothetical protein n=1 Tax=Arthrobacter sp. LAPM80 TaxID=3141788 RepID=UPI00398AC7A3